MSGTGYVLNGRYYRNGERPITGDRQPLAKQYEIDRQREEFRRDIIQPYLPSGEPNPEFIDAMPDQAEHYGFVNKEERNI